MAKTYGEIKRQTLEMINQSTMVGDPIAQSYNNQADYELRIPALINSAVMEIATTVKRETAVTALVDGETFNNMVRYKMPEDFYQMKTGGVFTTDSLGRLVKTNNFRLIGRDYVLVPNDASYNMEYYKYPNQLPSDPGDDFVFEVDPEVIDAAECYAAANLVSQENEFLYASLTNEYESRKNRITRGVRLETHPIEDSYAFSYGGDLY